MGLPYLVGGKSHPRFLESLVEKYPRKQKIPPPLKESGDPIYLRSLELESEEFRHFAQMLELPYRDLVRRLDHKEALRSAKDDDAKLEVILASVNAFHEENDRMRLFGASVSRLLGLVEDPRLSCGATRKLREYEVKNGAVLGVEYQVTARKGDVRVEVRPLNGGSLYGVSLDSAVLKRCLLEYPAAFVDVSQVQKEALKGVLRVFSSVCMDKFSGVDPMKLASLVVRDANRPLKEREYAFSMLAKGGLHYDIAPQRISRAMRVIVKSKSGLELIDEVYDAKSAHLLRSKVRGYPLLSLSVSTLTEKRQERSVRVLPDHVQLKFLREVFFGFGILDAQVSGVSLDDVMGRYKDTSTRDLLERHIRPSYERVPRPKSLGKPPKHTLEVHKSDSGVIQYSVTGPKGVVKSGTVLSVGQLKEEIVGQSLVLGKSNLEGKDLFLLEVSLSALNKVIASRGPLSRKE